MPNNPFYSITDFDNEWFSTFYDIYHISFPIHEQRKDKQQKKAFENNRYHLDVLVEDEKFISFIAWWDFNRYIYIEHFAVNPELRGQSLGSKTLRRFAEINNKVIILEIDPLIDEISKKRFEFYDKLGFQLNPYTHYHPAYKEGYAPHKLLVLSLHEKIDTDLYQQFKSDLSKIVMDI